MKHVGVREFRDHATKYLAGDEVLSIERYGVPIGYYLPAGSQSRKGSKEAKEARERLERTIQRILDRTGYTEEQLSRLFDLSIPVDQAIAELGLPELVEEQGEPAAHAKSVGP